MRRWHVETESNYLSQGAKLPDGKTTIHTSIAKVPKGTLRVMWTLTLMFHPAMGSSGEQHQPTTSSILPFRTRHKLINCLCIGASRAYRVQHIRSQKVLEIVLRTSETIRSKFDIVRAYLDADILSQNSNTIDQAIPQLLSLRTPEGD